VLSNDYNTVIHAINTGEPFAGVAEAPIAREVAALAEALARDVGLARPKEMAAAAQHGEKARGLGKLFGRFGRSEAVPAHPAPETTARAAREEAGVHAR
jgi:hypothetical protein